MLYLLPLMKGNLTVFKRLTSGLIAVTLFVTTLYPPSSFAQILSVPITLSQPFTPSLVRGITLYSDNPLKFDFIVDAGDDHLEGDAFQEESMKLIKYFLVSVTVPENDMWVNLSPYEKDRIIPDDFGKTEMGQELLLQDYRLKQLTASLMNPQEKLGEEFWNKVYKEAQEKYGTTDLPTFDPAHPSRPS